MKRMFKGFISLICAGAMVASAVAYSDSSLGVVSAAESVCVDIEGENTNAQNYKYDKWSSPVESYISETADGIMIAQYVEGTGVVAEYLNSDNQLTGYKIITPDLPIFGGIYLGKDSYYILSGQENMDENDSVEVMRITKYDKNWKKLGSCGLFGANTVYPFGAGADFAEYGNYLLVRTCHKMYASQKDGKNHQANVTIQIDAKNMKVTDAAYKVSNVSTGYVSHSFNQYIRVDNDKLYAVDHGDAYPRSVVLFKSGADLSSGSFDESSESTDLIKFSGNIGENYTGASLAGFEISSKAYLVAGNQDIADGIESGRNIFVVAEDKNTGTVTYNKITDYSAGNANTITPQFAPVGTDRYILLWPYNDKVYYTEIDANGKQKGSIYSMEGSLSDCKPVVIGKNLMWYVWKNETVNIYSIPVSDISSASSATAIIGHDYEYGTDVTDGKISLKCKKCGTVITKTVPTGFEDKYSEHEANAFYNYYSQLFNEGATYDLWLKLSGEYDLPQMEVASSDTATLSIGKDSKNTLLNMNKAGIALLSIKPKYNPQIGVSRIIRIGKEGQFDINSCNVEISYNDAGASSLSGLSPKVSVKYSDIELEEGVDYTYETVMSVDGVSSVTRITGKKLFANSTCEKQYNLGESSQGADGNKAYNNEWVKGQWYDANGNASYAAKLSWKSNEKGWWVEDSSGWYPVSKWQKIDGLWYYFKADGYMASNEWYDGCWLSGDGAWTYAATGSWKSDSKGWWFTDTSGWYPKNAWQKINGNWYAFGPDGYMYTNIYVDGYWVGSDGVCR